MRRILVALSLVWCGTISQALANSQAEICKSALIADQAHYSSNDRLRLAMASLIELYDLEALGLKPGASAVVYGIPWSGKLDEWANDKADYLSQYQYEPGDDKSWLYVSTHLSPAGAKAMLECLKNHQADAPVHLTVDKIDDKSAYLTVTAGRTEWGSVPRLVEITVQEGPHLVSKARLSVPPNGAQSVTLARDKEADLTMTAKVDSLLGDLITIPAEPYLQSCSMPIAPDAKPVPEGGGLTFICPMMRIGKAYTVGAAGSIGAELDAISANAGKKLNLEIGLLSSGVARSWLPNAAPPAPTAIMPFDVNLDAPALKVKAESVEVKLTVKQCNVGQSTARACLFGEGSVLEVQVKP